LNNLFYVGTAVDGGVCQYQTETVMHHRSWCALEKKMGRQKIHNVTFLSITLRHGLFVVIGTQNKTNLVKTKNGRKGRDAYPPAGCLRAAGEGPSFHDLAGDTVAESSASVAGREASEEVFSKSLFRLATLVFSLPCRSCRIASGVELRSLESPMKDDQAPVDRKASPRPNLATGSLAFFFSFARARALIHQTRVSRTK
jgi:hypothetical protein